MIEIMSKVTPESGIKELEAETLIRYFDMMNGQLQKLMNYNNEMKLYVKRGESEKCISALLQENSLQRDITEEMWELLRYFAE